MTDAYQEFEASRLFCPRCRRPVAVRKKLLLVLPTGNKYDYVCQDCGTPVGGKLDHDPSAFVTTRAATVPRPANLAPPRSNPAPPRSPRQRPV